MADFGLEVINDTGLIQINSVNVNYEVIATGSSASSGTPFSVNSISFISCPTPPMIFIRTTGAGAGAYFMNWIMSGSNYVGAKYLIYTNITIHFFVAAPQFSSSSDTWGMHIFNSAGEKVFDSGKPYLKIIDAIRLGTPNGYGGITYPSSSTLSHATTPQPYYCMGGGNSGVVDQDMLYQGAAAIQSNGTSSVIIRKSLSDSLLNPGNTLSFSTYGSVSYNSIGEDFIFQVPIIVGALGV